MGVGVIRGLKCIFWSISDRKPKWHLQMASGHFACDWLDSAYRRTQEFKSA